LKKRSVEKQRRRGTRSRGGRKKNPKKWEAGTQNAGGKVRNSRKIDGSFVIAEIWNLEARGLGKPFST